MPFLGQLMIARSRSALWTTSIYGVAILLILIYADFQRLLPTLLAMTPTLLAIPCLAGIMSYAGLAFNPLNVMALPVIIGISVDDGIHLLHRFFQEDGNLERTLQGTGRAIFLTSLTTLAGFGSLTFSSHPGLSSFGQLLSIGVLCALIISLFILPQLLQIFSKFLLKNQPAGSS